MIIGTCGFRPLTGISLFLLVGYCVWSHSYTVFVPSRGFLFFYLPKVLPPSFFFVFVPSREFLFFYLSQKSVWQSHKIVFVPSRGFLFFYESSKGIYKKRLYVFVPSRGFLFFYRICPMQNVYFWFSFSSPHGDFSFSINMENCSSCTNLFSSPHGDFSFSMKE